jgi:hypothetical protein
LSGYLMLVMNWKDCEEERSKTSRYAWALRSPLKRKLSHSAEKKKMPFNTN